MHRVFAKSLQGVVAINWGLVNYLWMVNLRGAKKAGSQTEASLEALQGRLRSYFCGTWATSSMLVEVM